MSKESAPQPIHSEIDIDVTPPAKPDAKKTLYVRIKENNFDFLQKSAKKAGLSLAVFIDRVAEGLRKAK